MLAFTQHAYMLLAAKAMPFWTSLLTSSERSASRIEPLAPENSPIPLECVVVLMDLAGKLTIHIGGIAPAVPALGIHGLATCRCIPCVISEGSLLACTRSDRKGMCLPFFN
jgi:hypothetical protein